MHWISASNAVKVPGGLPRTPLRNRAVTHSRGASAAGTPTPRAADTGAACARLETRRGRNPSEAPAGHRGPTAACESGSFCPWSPGRQLSQILRLPPRIISYLTDYNHLLSCSFLFFSATLCRGFATSSSLVRRLQPPLGFHPPQAAGSTCPGPHRPRSSCSPQGLPSATGTKDRLARLFFRSRSNMSPHGCPAHALRPLLSCLPRHVLSARRPALGTWPGKQLHWSGPHSS